MMRTSGAGYRGEPPSLAFLELWIRHDLFPVNR
jgi:hypothetical protein